MDAVFAEYHYKYFLVFTQPELKETFLNMDPVVLRAWEQSVMIPDASVSLEGHYNPISPPTPADTYHCQVCQATFTTYKQLRTHESMMHDYRCVASLLTPHQLLCQLQHCFCLSGVSYTTPAKLTSEGAL